MGANIYGLGNFPAAQPAAGPALTPLDQIQYDAIDPVRKRQLSSEIGRKALKELAVSLVLTTATAFFVAGPAGIVILYVCSAATVLFNAIMRSATRHYLFHLERVTIELRTPNLPADRRANLTRLQAHLDARYRFCHLWEQRICPSAFVGMHYAYGPGTMIHEAGHAMTACMVYKDANPTISVTPFGGGETRYNASALTPLGKAFGESGSRMFVAGAGAGLWVILSSIALIFSHKYKNATTATGARAPDEGKRELSRYLWLTAITAIAQHVFYALSALGASLKEDTGHDFIRLAIGGVHPIVSAISILVIPFLVRGIYMLYEKHRNRRAGVAAPAAAGAAAAPGVPPAGGGPAVPPAGAPPRMPGTGYLLGRGGPVLARA